MIRSKERREHRRVVEKHNVKFTVTSCQPEPQIEGRSFTGTTQNLSVGGIQFQARRAIPLGTEMDVHIECKRPHEEFGRTARVVWSQEGSSTSRPIVGVHFTNVSKQNAIEWKRMLERRLLQKA